MQTEPTMMSGRDFIAKRPYANAEGVTENQTAIFDTLIAKFKPLPLELEESEYDVLLEVGSFLIMQGVCVEILRLEYEQVEGYQFIIDIAFEPDAHNLTCLSNGSRRRHCTWLIADSYKHAVETIASIMIEAEGQY